ncbi:MAG: hypothetical protein U0232_28360, partial [Thermomicrobiales bacterium]
MQVSLPRRILRILLALVVVANLAVLAGGPLTPQGAAADPTIDEFPGPPPVDGPTGIVAGPDGNLWFTLRSGNKVAKITTAGEVTEYPLPNCTCSPEGI